MLLRGLGETAGRTYMCGITKIILAQFLLNCQFLKSRFMLPAKYLNISFVWIWAECNKGPNCKQLIKTMFNAKGLTENYHPTLQVLYGTFYCLSAHCFGLRAC